jgi:hypothetical protein
MQVRDPELLCKAVRAGKRCNNYRMHAQQVCRIHGGGSPQAREKAQEYLDRQTYPLLVRLRDIAFDDNTPPDVAVKAIREALSHSREIQAPGTRMEVRGTSDLRPAVLALMDNPPVMQGETLDSVTVVTTLPRANSPLALPQGDEQAT